MSKVLVEESNLTAIASAIRQKLGVQTTYKPGQMATAIGTIHGESVLETLTATANGSYSPSTGKDGFSAVTVNVPNTYAAGDEGKVVSSGALVAQTARTSDITQNGTYDTTENNSVTVNVSGGGSPTLITKTIMQNGTYNASSDNADGYSQVIVNISGSAGTTLNFHLGKLKIDTGDIVEDNNYCYSDLIPISNGNGQWFIDLARSDVDSYYIGICAYGQDGETNVGYIRQYTSYRSYMSSGMSNARYFRIANKVSNLSFASMAFLLDSIHVTPQGSSTYQINPV